MPKDIHLFTRKHRNDLVEWCDQVPVLGFNCGRYDLYDLYDLGLGTGYEAWVKAYRCSAQKSWLPYEWLDTPEKLNYPGLQIK